MHSQLTVDMTEKKSSQTFRSSSLSNNIDNTHLENPLNHVSPPRTRHHTRTADSQTISSKNQEQYPHYNLLPKISTKSSQGYSKRTRATGRTSSICVEQDVADPASLIRRTTSFQLIPRFFTSDKQDQYYTSSLKRTLFSQDEQILYLVVQYAISTFDYWKAHCLRTLEDHWKSVLCLIAFPNNGYLVSGCRDSTIKIWDVDEGKCVATLLGHSKAVNCVMPLNNGLLGSASDDFSMRLWDLNSHEWTIKMEHSAPVVAICSLGHAPYRIMSNDFWIFSAAGTTIYIWDPLSSRHLKVIETHSQSNIISMAIVDHFLISLNKDGSIQIRDLEPILSHGNKAAIPVIFALPSVEDVSQPSSPKLTEIKMSPSFGPESKRKCIIPTPLNVILPVGNNLVAYADRSRINLLDYTTGTITTTLKGHSGTVLSLALMENGYLVSGGADNTIRIWNVASGELLRIIGEEEDQHTEAIRSLTVLDNGWLISGSDDRDIKFWGNVYPGSEDDYDVRKISVSMLDETPHLPDSPISPQDALRLGRATSMNFVIRHNKGASAGGINVSKIPGLGTVINM